MKKFKNLSSIDLRNKGRDNLMIVKKLLFWILVHIIKIIISLDENNYIQVHAKYSIFLLV